MSIFSPHFSAFKRLIRGFRLPVTDYKSHEKAKLFRASARSASLSTTDYKLSTSVGGFSLVELVVSIGILLIIISILVFRFTSFDSIILLRTLAYDIGLSIREAQSYSLSAKGISVGGDLAFDIPYGVSFTPGNTSYAFYGYTGSNETPRYEQAEVQTIDLYKLGRSFEIYDVCVAIGIDGEEQCGIDRLDISFKRPEYTSIFYATNCTGSCDLSSVGKGIVKVRSTRNPDIVARVEITYTGQIDACVEGAKGCP